MRTILYKACEILLPLSLLFFVGAIFYWPLLYAALGSIFVAVVCDEIAERIGRKRTQWDCPAKHCPDRTGKLKKICKRCGTYTDKDIDCPMTYCEAFPKECNGDSIHCKRCSNFDNCY